MNEYKKTWKYFVTKCKELFTPIIKKNFPEFYEEMVGFANGCQIQKVDFTLDDVITWNNFITITEYWFPHIKPSKYKNKDRCSAFMAVGGNWTNDGKIVMAHNTFSEFLDGQLCNYVLDIQPEQGNRILMTTFPGWIWSGTDFFVTSSGIMGTETTIGNFKKYRHEFPISCRIRKAMQYATTLDEYTNILLEGNSGDYANAWLIGNIKTNEIMRLELGLNYHHVEKTKNGYFIGFNGVYDTRIRLKECDGNTGFDDIQSGRGARRKRLDDLMNIYKGKLNISNAKNIISDHYDSFLEKHVKSSRTICGHYEEDDSKHSNSFNHKFKPFQPRGAVDGSVCDSSMASQMSFLARWGNSCGTPFIVKTFCKLHPEWKHLSPFLLDRYQQPWALFKVLKLKQKTRKKT
jgi:hypothetical protein